MNNRKRYRVVRFGKQIGRLAVLASELNCPYEKIVQTFCKDLTKDEIAYFQEYINQNLVKPEMDYNWNDIEEDTDEKDS